MSVVNTPLLQPRTLFKSVNHCNIIVSVLLFYMYVCTVLMMTLFKDFNQDVNEKVSFRISVSKYGMLQASHRHYYDEKHAKLYGFDHCKLHESFLMMI